MYMGNYIEKNLGKDEHVIKQAEFHWSRLLGSIVLCLMGAGAIISGLYLRNEGESLSLPVIFSGAFLLLFGIIDLVKKMHIDVGFTNKNMISKSGVIAQNLKTYPLEKIDNVEMKKSVFGRVFDCGKISITTAGSNTNNKNSAITFSGMKYCDDFKNTLMEAIDNCKDEAAKKNAKAMAEALGNKGSQTSSVDEIKKLKELLDSGILSQEEFDTKKKQLLGL